MNIQNFKCFKKMFFVLHLRVQLLNYLKDATPIDFAYAVHTKIGNSAIGCEINGNKSRTYKQILRNGDRVNIITSKKPCFSIITLDTYSTKTGKARAAIRRYWHEKGEEKKNKKLKNIIQHFGYHYQISQVNLGNKLFNR